VLYEDADKRGRAPGEMLALVGSALRAARPGIDCQEAENPADALRAALAVANGAPVLFVYENLALAHDALVAVGAQPWPEASRPATAESVVAAAETMTKEVASALGAAPGAPPAVSPALPTPVVTTALLPEQSAGVRADTACDCDPLTRSGWPRLPGADGSADYGSAGYGGACGCQPAG
jgi:hypothetical protein